ncbi:hypothetical protein AB0O34_05030 [Sphaerisporangium sp. NPDC088356]|uniref:hypothetical protein n=1 Tax=Sphaerisporangium sp. NPDC088356 TaxID=3154871 RepID=UPI0034390698
MTGEGYRVLLSARRRSDILRAKGFTYEQIAAVLALDHQVSPLRLYRFAQGRTVSEVVNAFNDLDPAGAASLRDARLYDYELHPRAGRKPPLRALTTLARIYQTSARQLVSDSDYGTYCPLDREALDRADFRHWDRHYHRPSAAGSSCASMKETPAWLAQSREARTGLQPEECADLLRALGAEEADVKRRDLLIELALTLGGMPALALLRHLTPEEEVRLARAGRAEGRVDAAAVATIEKLTAQCRRLDDALGPKTVLPVVDAQRDLVTRLLRRESLLPALRDRLIGVYAELSQLSGYLHYDLADYQAATKRFENSLEAALEIGNATLLAYVHHWLSDMASFQGLPAKAFDHAFAAQGWARRSPSHLLRARTNIVESWALALDGRPTPSLRLLETARNEAQKPTPADPPYLYWITESSALEGSSCFCFNALRRPDATITTVTAQLDSLPGETYSREQAFGLIHHGNALIQKREIPEAAAKLSEAASVMAVHSSARLIHSLRSARRQLQPWSTYTHVRDLDEELHTLGFTDKQ